VSDLERPTKVETVDKDGKLWTNDGQFTLVLDQEHDRIGVKDESGHVIRVPLSDVVELIRSKIA